MRILHADTDDLDNPLRGGQPVRTYEVNSRLSAYHDITVLTASYAGAQRRVQRGAIDYRRLGVTIPGLGLSPHLSFLASLGLAVRRLPHDLLVEEFTPPIGFSMLPWWTRRPVVCLVQWFNFGHWEHRYGLPFEKIMRMASRRAGYRNFIVQTRRMRAYFEALIPGARIWTLGCGVADECFQPPGPEGAYALYLGRLDVQQKGLDMLIQAWSHNQGHGPPIPLKIVGDGPGRDMLERHIAAHGLGDHVTLLGRLEGARKRELLQGCALVVMPSRQETFGIVALEAMAASKAVVTFDIDDLNELLRPEWAVLAGPPDARALAAAVLALWSDPHRRRLLGERAFQAAQPYRWDAVAQQQGAIYNEIVEAADER